MITETFLRRPHGTGETLADAVRLLGVLSIVAAVIGWGFVEIAVFALTLLGMLVPRFLGVRPGFDIAVGATLLVASWSGVFELYTSIDWLDIVVHFATNGLLAALLFVVAVHCAVVAPVASGTPSLVRSALLTTVFGLAAGCCGRWANGPGTPSSTPRSSWGTPDTIGDLAVGGLGSLVAGLGIRWLTSQSRWVGPGASTREYALRSER